MKVKIGIFGSANASNPSKDVTELARQIGQALGAYKDEVIIITGGCSGIPYAAASTAAKLGVEVWGFSPVRSMEEQREFTPDDDLSIYTKLVFIPEELPFLGVRRKCMKYRNVLSTSESDGGIIISGKWGSLNEFTNLIDMQKVIGVLLGSGGIADELPDLMTKIHKEGQDEVLFQSEPKKLVEELLKKIKV